MTKWRLMPWSSRTMLEGQGRGQTTGFLETVHAHLPYTPRTYTHCTHKTSSHAFICSCLLPGAFNTETDNPKLSTQEKELTNQQTHTILRPCKTLVTRRKSFRKPEPSRFFAAQSLAARARLCAEEDSEIWPQAAVKGTEKTRKQAKSDS